MTYAFSLHTVLETNAYLAAARSAGMSQEERDDIVTLLAIDPMMGDPISGTGGFRKFRYRKPGTGKSGGYRVITFYSGERHPVFLITVFGKNEKANLTKSERNDLAKLAKRLVEGFR